jgi:hypothetical protein
MVVGRIAAALGKAVAPRVKQVLIGAEDQRALDRVLRSAIKSAAGTFPEPADDYLISLFEDECVADLLVEAAFADRGLDREAVEDRLVQLGYDASTSAVDLGSFAAALCRELHAEIRREAAGSDGKLFHRLVLSKLDMLAGRAGPEVHRGHLPPRPGLMVGRAGAVEHLVARLTAEAGSASAMPVIAVRGWPGVGKSSLVAAVAHHPSTARFFTDGVFWAPLSETPDTRGHLQIWCRVAGVGELRADDPTAIMSAHLAAALRDKRALLLVDDVWQAGHAAPLLVGGGRCGALVTTRSTEVAAALTSEPGRIYPLPVLDDDDAIDLMRQLAPAVVHDHRDTTAVLVRELEGLPLALQVAGRLLAAEHGLGWGVESLLDELRDGARLLAAEAPADRADLATATTPTIAALLAKSTDRLAEPLRVQFAMLGAFAEKPAVFDSAAVSALWLVGDPRPALRELASRGLLEPVGGGHFQLHALLAMHARAILATA